MIFDHGGSTRESMYTSVATRAHLFLAVHDLSNPQSLLNLNYMLTRLKLTDPDTILYVGTSSDKLTVHPNPY